MRVKKNNSDFVMNVSQIISAFSFIMQWVIYLLFIYITNFVCLNESSPSRCILAITHIAGRVIFQEWLLYSWQQWSTNAAHPDPEFLSTLETVYPYFKFWKTQYSWFWQLSFVLYVFLAVEWTTSTLSYGLIRPYFRMRIFTCTH